MLDQLDSRKEETYCLANDAQLALCSLYANRWYTMQRLHRVCARLGLKAELKIWDQFLIRRTGQRMVTFISDVVRLQDGHTVTYKSTDLVAQPPYLPKDASGSRALLSMSGKMR